MMTRRQALQTTVLVTAAATVAPAALAQDPAPGKLGSGIHVVPPLGYAFDALEPHVDARTMEIHHDRHHKAYVDNLNKAIAAHPDVLKAKTTEEMLRNLASVPDDVRTVIRNSGGGHFNHKLFWQMMKKDGGGEPKGELAKAIEKGFGSYGAFKEAFSKAALGQFGSGWAWLVATPGALINGSVPLTVEATPNQDSPVMLPPISKDLADFAKDYSPGKLTSAKVPLLGLDVWEHAYYLKYQNKRADYVAAWWNVVNWDFVAERYAKLAK